ncbi:hypothetical protein C8R46DRAFT_1346987 [Mycena filopes]|nr:hypothetical protein C8R46DRAFT_1346987 [Mycena filopes]
MTPEEELDLFGADDSVADDDSSSTGTGDVQMEMQIDDHSFQEGAQAHPLPAGAEPRVVIEQFHRALALGLFPVPASSSSHAGRAAQRHGAFLQQQTFAPVGMPPYPRATLSRPRVNATPAIQYTLPPPPNAFAASSLSHFPDARHLTPSQARPPYEQQQPGHWFAPLPTQRPPLQQYYQAPDATVASRYAYSPFVPRNFDGGIPPQTTPSFPFPQTFSPLAGYAVNPPNTSTLSGAFAQPSGAGRATPAVPMPHNYGRVQATAQAQPRALHHAAFLAQTQVYTTGGIYPAHPAQITGPRPERALPRRALPLQGDHGPSVGGGSFAGPPGGVSGLQNYALAPPPQVTHLSVLPPTTTDGLEFVQDDAAFPVVAVAKKRKRKQKEQSDSDASQPAAKKPKKKKNTSVPPPAPRPTPPGRESIDEIIANAQPERDVSDFRCRMPCRCPGNADQSQPCRGKAPCDKNCRGKGNLLGAPRLLETHLVRCHSLLRKGKGGPKIPCVWRSPNFASGYPAPCTEVLEQHEMAAHITKDHLRSTWKECEFCQELFHRIPQYRLHLHSCEEYWNPKPWATQFPPKS